ncbi:GPI transamidase component [Rhodotorula kratochvilovae]
MAESARLPSSSPAKPPPRAEPPALPVDVRSRRLIVAAFWAVILVGLPLWWNATALERRALPEARVREWAANWDGRIPRAEGDLNEPDARVVKYSPHYKLVFSLLNQDSSAGSSILAWDAHGLLSRHIQPLLSSLSPLHNFTIETQVQYFAPLAVELHKEDDSEGSYVDEHDLRAFVNNADWNLASGDTLDPVLHFLLYVPSPENRPLQIRDSNGVVTTPAFITPQRGGVVIFNPPSPSPSTPPSNPLALPPSAFAPSFRLFASQLRTLLGVPPSPASEREPLIRARLREAARDSVETLDALVTLAGEIRNMRISREVQARVGAALDALDAAALAAPSSPAEALHHAASAQSLAAKAYFDPSMLALLYFPDEHKYAVYTPLFGPVAVPLLVALLREVKEWRAGRRKKREGEKGGSEGEKGKVD